MTATRIRYIDLETEGMPLDRFDQDTGFVHATGREYWDPVPGCWRTEYEDSATAGLPVTESDWYTRLLPQARELERHIDTDWADEHADAYDDFAALLEDAWSNGDLTDAEFNALASIAFFDYPEGLKGDEDDEDLIEQELALDQPDRRYHGGCERRNRP